MYGFCECIVLGVHINEWCLNGTVVSDIGFVVTDSTSDGASNGTVVTDNDSTSDGTVETDIGSVVTVSTSDGASNGTVVTDNGTDNGASNGMLVKRSSFKQHNFLQIGCCVLYSG